MMTVQVVALFLGAYLCGSIPFGVLIGRACRGVDIRQYGSGNIGFSNALRVLGWKPAAVGVRCRWPEGRPPGSGRARPAHAVAGAARRLC